MDEQATPGTGGQDTSPAPAAESTPTVDSIFDEVSASLGASATPAPAPAPAASSQPAPATSEPTPAPPPAVPAKPAGEPPQERWPVILENARVKEREAFQREYGGALEVVRQLREDPVGTVAQLLSELQAHPTYGPQAVSQAARMLGAARRPAAAVDEEPGPDIDGGNGILLYSAPQQAKREAWLKRQMQSEVEAVIAPLKEDHEARQQETKARVAFEQRVSGVKSLLSEFEGRPYFKEHKDAIRAKQAEIYAAMPEARRDHRVALGLAYGLIVAEKAVPQAHAQSQQSLVEAAAKKLQGATHNPATSAPAQSRKPRSLDEAFEQALAEVG